MMRLFLCVLTFFHFNFTYAQKSISHALNEGENVNEVLQLSDSSGNTVHIRIPSDSCMLFYKMRGQNWLTDNSDSIAKVEQIVNDLLKASNTFKNIRVICYIYNQDKYQNIVSKPVFEKPGFYHIENYYLSAKNNSKIFTSGKLILVNKKGKILSQSNYIGNWSYLHKDDVKILKAKLLTEKDGIKLPLENAKVYLKSDAIIDSTTSAKTNKYGDFELTVPDNAVQHALHIRTSDPSVDNVILASQEGVEKTRLLRIGDGFEYKFIDAEINKLSEMDVDDDIVLSTRNFLNTNGKVYSKSEFINYNVGSYKMEEESKKILDKVAALLSDNPKLRLEVISHTDSQGDDKSNLLLSEKRSLNVMSYLILIGVHKDRLSYSGKGETQIRNRCTNGVDCSPIEHQYNRRTEFKFYRE